VDPVDSSVTWELNRKPVYAPQELQDPFEDDPQSAEETRVLRVRQHDSERERARTLVLIRVEPRQGNRSVYSGYEKVIRSRLEPMTRAARMIRHRQPLIGNRFVARGRISGGVGKKFNNSAILTTKKAYEFRESKSLEIGVYHQLGNPPETESPTDSGEEALFSGTDLAIVPRLYNLNFASFESHPESQFRDMQRCPE